MEQIRVVKEMRNESVKQLQMRGSDIDVRLIKPRWMVWENVPGAFSSNGGKDFQAVLSEIVKIAEPEAPDVPLPEKGKWPTAGELHDEMGKWSLAYKVVDAQYWGTPQRRRRISLVFDGGGVLASEVLFKQYSGAESEPEIQFKPESLSGHSDESRAQRKDSAGAVGNSLAQTGEGGSISFQERAGKPGGGKGILLQKEHTGALSTLNNQSVFGISSFESNAMKSSNPNSGFYEADTARTLDNNGGSPDCHQGGMAVVYDASRRHDYQPFGDVSETVQAQHGTGGNNQPIVLEGNGARASYKGDGWKESETMYTLNTVENHAVYDARGNGDGETVPTITGDHENRITDYTAVCIGNGQVDQLGQSDLVGALNCMHDQQAVMTYGLDRASFNQGKNAKFNFSVEKELIGAQVAKGPGAVANASVRRLTPGECELLQGFPLNWTNIGEWVDSKGKKHKDADSPRYKALGNSIALPSWYHLLREISRTYDEGYTPTLGSLFDGIGGFPLCWEMCNGKGSARWASEIEEFPIAVTKVRFPESNSEL